MTQEATDGRDQNLDKNKVEDQKIDDKKVDDLDGRNIDDLTEEDLERVKVDDSGTITLTKPEKDESAGDKSITDKTEKKPKDPADDESITGDKGEGDKDVKPEGDKKEKEGGDQEVVHDPLKDTQTAYHKEREENVQLNKKLRDAQKRIVALEQPREPQYTEEQLDDMKTYDPEKYAQAVKEKADYEREKVDHDKKVEDLDAEIIKNTRAIASSTTVASIITAAGEITGVKGRLGIKLEDQPKEFQDFVNSPGFGATMEKIDSNASRWYDEDGSISPETILMVYDWETRKETRAKAAATSRKDGRQQATDAIEKARHTGSKLDQLPKDDVSQTTKKTEDLTQAEIADMPEDELARTLKEAETQGMTGE